MKKNLLNCVKFITCMAAAGILLSSCGIGASVPSNGGIPTEEQLSAATDELGDNVSSLKFSADGVICQFPVSTNDMLGLGWYFDNDVKSELKNIPANTLVAPAVPMRKNAADGYAATSCSVQPANKSSSEITLEESMLYNITFSKSNGTTVILPMGITWNSTFDEVKEAYHPEEAVDKNGIKYIRILGEDHNYSLMLNFNSTDNTIDTIEFSGRL